MRKVLSWVALVGLVLAGSRAEAFNWMIRHGYSNCMGCHTDPSGSGMLTDYGRALSEVALQWRAGPPPKDEGDVSPVNGFLFGLVEPPEWLNLSGNVRLGGMGTFAQGADPRFFPLAMATDLRAQVTLGPVRGHLTLGYAPRRAELAAVTRGTENLLVSREHWLGVDLADSALLVRAGRMNLPFGLRNNEHIAWVRDATRTDINTGQQHGLAVAYNGEKLRGELMAIAGNFQLGPDLFRERGYSGYAEYAAAENLAVGLSSLLATSGRDLRLGEPLLRQAHGAYARWALSPKVVLLGEADLLLNSLGANPMAVGYTGLLQADYEPIQGLHLMATAETLQQGVGGLGPAVGGWLSALWFVAPHTELRLDWINRSQPLQTGGAAFSSSLLLQVHLYL
jgi:hypothetical protein